MALGVSAVVLAALVLWEFMAMNRQARQATEYEEALKALERDYGEAAAVDGWTVPSWVVIAEAGEGGRPVLTLIRRVEVLRRWRESRPEAETVV